MCSTIFAGVVGSDGSKMPLYWFQRRKGERGINQDHYIEASLKILTAMLIHKMKIHIQIQVLEEVVIPWIKTRYDDRDIVWCFQQVRIIV